jgi:putative DNA primase/helicase
MPGSKFLPEAHLFNPSAVLARPATWGQNGVFKNMSNNNKNRKSLGNKISEDVQGHGQGPEQATESPPPGRKQAPGISKEDFNKGVDALPGQAPLKLVDYEYKPEELPEGLFPEKDIYKALEENEIGDATLVINLFKGLRLHDHRVSKRAAWHYWNDHYWREDEQLEIFWLVNDVVALYYEQRKKEEYRLDQLALNSKLSQERREQVEKDLKIKIKRLKDREQSLLTLKRRENVLKISSRGVNSLGYVGDGWDQNPWLLGCKNGVINLKTGKRRDGRPEDYIKTVCPVKWDDNATCPRWKSFLSEIFEGDQEVVDFLQRLLGYSITGLRTEHIYPILWGDHGRNGKGTIVETMKLILGDMAYKASTQMLMQGIQQKNSGPNSGLMKFRGARLVWTSEAQRQDSLDTSVVKSLSGGDTITARNPFDRKESVFTPSHTLFTLTNPLPRIDPDDDAFWTRVMLIPFNLSFVENPQKSWERQKDGELENTLSQELPGILRWLVEGTQLWQKHGFAIPKKLTTAKSIYRENEDIIRTFLQERCIVDLSDAAKKSISMRVKAKVLYAQYQEWCKESGYKPLNQKNFNTSIKRKLGEQKASGGVWTYRGVALNDGFEGTGI